MYKKPSKRKELTNRIFIYSIMTLGVIALVTILVMIIAGYRFNPASGKIQQTALVQFDSTPSGATIEVSAKPLSGKTPAKTNIQAGTYEFVMWREGYETWRKTISVEAGTLTWLNYARLMPKDRSVTAVANYKELTSSLASRKGRAILLHEKATSPEFTLADLRSAEVKTQKLTIPATVYLEATTPDVAHTFTAQSWDDSERYVLVRHQYADKHEWIVLDTQQNTARSVTQTLGVQTETIAFAGTNGNILYGIVDGGLRRLDLASETISRVVIPNAASFDVYDGNIVTYITAPNEQTGERTAGVYKDGDDEPQSLRTIKDPAVGVSIATTRFLSQDYVAIAEGGEVQLLKGSYPTTHNKDGLKQRRTFNLKGLPIDRVSFGANGNILTMQAGAMFGGYNIERDTFNTAMNSGTRPLQWLDSFYLWSDNGDTLIIRDFDGDNITEMSSVAPGQAVTLSQNGRYLYSIGTSKNGYQLQRTKMIL